MKAKGKKKRISGIIVLLVILLIGFMWINNSNFSKTETLPHRWMAHRGVYQTFDVSQVDNETNTAVVIHEPTHEYLENTIPSMQAAFENGAAMVEFDIKLSKDEKLAVFHDSELGYRTNLTGEIQDYSMEELKRADIGYGYTADGGQSYPFRGKGVGMMPELFEVLEAFPQKPLLIHIKDGKLRTVEVLSQFLSTLPQSSDEYLFFYGNDDSIHYLKEHHPSYKYFSRGAMMRGLIQYELVGWTGAVPEAMQNSVILLPSDYAPFLWGFPEKFVHRMEAANSIVILANGDGSPTDGFDTEEDYLSIPSGYNGLLWTNQIEKMGEKEK